MRDLVTNIVTDLQSLGLLLDFIGILVLGLPLALKGHSKIGEQASTYWDMNPPLAKDMFTAKLDAMLGTGILATGFALQIVDSQCQERVSEATGWSWLGVVAAVCAVHLCLRSRYAKRHVTRLQREAAEEKEREAKEKAD